MTWVRIDDAAPDHPKLVGLDDEAFALWVRGLCYCARHATDGEIPAAAVRRLTGARKPEAVAERLVTAGLWRRDAEFGAVVGSYTVHDFLDYNPSAEQTRAKREARATAGRAGGIRSGQSRSKSEANGEAIASVVASPMSNPVPSRPDPDPDQISPLDPPSRGAEPERGEVGQLFPEEPKVAKSRTRRAGMAHRPASWEPNEGHYERAAADGLSRAEVLAEVQRWTDFHTARGTLIADFDASFRTWLGNVRRFRGAGPRANGRSTLQQPAKPGEYRWRGDEPEDRY